MGKVEQLMEEIVNSLSRQESLNPFTLSREYIYRDVGDRQKKMIKVRVKLEEVEEQPGLLFRTIFQKERIDTMANRYPVNIQEHLLTAFTRGVAKKGWKRKETKVSKSDLLDLMTPEETMEFLAELSKTMIRETASLGMK